MARRQHGVVSIRQLEQLFGYSRAGVTRLVDSGRLHRVHRGVYAVGHTDLSRHGECLAAVLAVGPGALLSYHSAGWLWGIWRGSPRPFHVTAVIPRHHPAPRDAIRHRARNLVDDDRAVADGIPVTSVARTLLDLASKLRADQLRRALSQAEDLELLDFAAVEATIDGNSGHHGAKRLRRALATYEPPVYTTPAPSSSGASSSIWSAPAYRVPPPVGTRSATSSTSIGRSTASGSNSTPMRRMAPATLSSATTIGTSTSRWPGSRRSGSAKVSSAANPTRSRLVSRRS